MNEASNFCSYGCDPYGISSHVLLSAYLANSLQGQHRRVMILPNQHRRHEITLVESFPDFPRISSHLPLQRQNGNPQVVWPDFLVVIS